MRFNKSKAVRTTIYLLIVIIMVATTAVIFFKADFSRDDFYFGVHFSPQYAEELGLDWQETYLAILDDLQVKHLRLAAPWDEVEKVRGAWNFAELDWQIAEATKRDIDIILVLGRRTPRWPECHDPVWLDALSQKLVKAEQLEMVAEVVKRYKNENGVVAWQVENEPMLDSFGDCPPADVDLLRREVAVVKNLDDRPVLITDSGELGFWATPSRVGDLFGTTLYRVTHNQFLGYFYYHLPPAFYNLKARLTAKDLDEIIISELQGEPWARVPMKEMSLEEMKYSMDTERLKIHADYAKKTGLSAAYWWGAEWWYWMKQVKGDDSLWRTAKEIMRE